MNALASVRLHYAVRVGLGRDSYRTEFAAGDEYEIMDEGRGWISIRERASGDCKRVPYAGVKDVEPFSLPPVTKCPDHPEPWSCTGDASAVGCETCIRLKNWVIYEAKSEPPPTRRRRKEG